KTPVVCPAAIAVVEGTVRLALLLDRAIANPSEGAPPDNVTVQFEVPGAFTVAGEQLKLLSWTAATRLMVAGWLWPFKVAVTVAFWLLLTVPEVAAKVALLWPEPTVTLG